MAKLKAAGTMSYKKGPFNFNKTKKMNYEGNEHQRILEESRHFG